MDILDGYPWLLVIGKFSLYVCILIAMLNTGILAMKMKQILIKKIKSLGGLLIPGAKI